MSDKNFLNSIVSFNQIQVELTQSIQNIIHKYKQNYKRGSKALHVDYEYFNKLISNDNIIFNNSSIILFNFLELKISYKGNNTELLVNFLHHANKEYFQLINLVDSHWNEFLRILIIWDKNFKLFGEPINNFLDIKYLNSITSQLKNNINFDMILPMKNIIYQNNVALFDSLNINNNFELILNLKKKNEQIFLFEILLLETKNIDVTKATPYLLADIPQKLLIDGEKPILELYNFLNELYAYGRI